MLEVKIQDNIISNFISDIEQIREIGNVEYMDAVIHYCEENGLELEDIGAFIRNNVTMIQSKIQEEAENLNFLEKSARLPL